MMFQIAICTVIYIIFYLIQNSNYIFSEDVLNKTREFLSYDINWENISSQVSSFIENNKDFFGFLGFIDEENTENQNNSNNINNEINQEENNNVNETTGGIGGGDSNEVIEEEQEGNNDDGKTQNEKDIEYIKENFSFILPTKGTVTSRYGNREATEVVSANHQGIDIGSEEGTAIYASMDGIVTVASEEGEYGKHIDIENEDVLTRYAHCSKLLVKEGQEIKQGGKIAEVGSTGNSTGPHLHFEIRRNDRTINPESILDFDKLEEI